MLQELLLMHIFHIKSEREKPAILKMKSAGSYIGARKHTPFLDPEGSSFL